MFFIGIMGVDSKEEKIKSVSSECPNCSANYLTLIQNYNRFHFFFVPLFKWAHSYYLLCETCNSLYGISDEKGRNLSIRDDVELTYWDLSPIYVEKICKSCKRSLNGSFEYCPYCGNKQT